MDVSQLDIVVRYTRENTTKILLTTQKASYFFPSDTSSNAQADPQRQWSMCNHAGVNMEKKDHVQSSG